MDTFDSYRPSVPARLPASRNGALVPRASSGLPEVAAPQSPLSIRVIFRGARRYWWLVLVLWVGLSAGLGTAIYLKVKPSYRAHNTLRAEAEFTIFDAKANAETLELYLQTQVNLITSSNVLTAAGSDPRVKGLRRIVEAGDVVQELKKLLTVGVVPQTSLIEVSVTSPDALEAQAVVNAVVDSFVAANSEWAEGSTQAQIASLETYHRKLNGLLGDLELKWKRLVEAGDPDAMIRAQYVGRKSGGEGEAQGSGFGVTFEEFKSIRQKLLEVDLDLAQAQAWLEAAKLAAASNAVDRGDGGKEQVEAAVKRRVQSDPEITAVWSKISEARNKLEHARRIARESTDPSTRAALLKYTNLQNHYNDLWNTRAQAYRDEIQAETGRGGGGSLDQEVRDAEDKVNSLLATQRALTQKSKNLQGQNSKLASDAVEITLVMDERATLKQMQDTVNRRLEELKFTRSGGPRIRPVNKDGALLPVRPMSDKRLTFMAVTPIGVLGSVLCLVVLLEIRAGRVGDPEQLSSRVKHEVFSIAPLPDLRPGDDPNDERSEQKLARFVQSLDHLRVATCEGGAAGEGRCVMITSATGGEGKTTLSAHLAARCANAGTSTLLIDADLRRGSLGRLLDVPVGPGLGDVLGGDLDLDEALITVQAGGFHFLSAGSPGRDPARVLKSSHLSDLIGRLRRSYDLVIIDTPPVLPVADALILGRWVDGAVVAARFDASRLPLVERANRQLGLAGIPILGVVVNGVRGQDATYGSYAYDYNYYPGRDGRSAGPTPA